MFHLPRLIQIRDDDAPGIFLGVDEKVVADVEPDMIGRHAIGEKK